MNETLLFVIGTLVFTITIWGLLVAGYKATDDASKRDSAQRYRKKSLTAALNFIERFQI